MTPKSVIGLGVVTFVAVVAAAVSIADQYGKTRQAGIEEPIVAGLEDRINDVASLSVKSSDDAFTVNRGANGWTIAEKGGFPADGKMVRRVLFQLSQLRLIEPKTQMSERYPLLEVEDVTADAKSALLTIADESGAVAASVIVGKTKLDLAGATGKGVYLRRPDEKQAWLARGELTVRKSVSDWLAKDILNIGEDGIRRVTSTQADGEVIVYSRDDPTSKEFVIADLPEGKSLKKDVLKDLPAALSGLRLTDVAPASEKALPSDRMIRAEVLTFDGLIVDIGMQDSEEGIWATFAAKGSEELAGKIDEINGRLAGWVYRVPDVKFRPLLKKLDDLVDG